MPKLVIVGGTYQQLRMQVEVPPNAGETALDGRYAEIQSGAGSRIAIAVAKLGADVDLVSAIGDDAAGEAALAQWRAYGVQAQHVTQVTDAHTGREMVIAGEEGQALTALASGANARLSTAHVQAAQEAIAAADLLVATLEVPPNIAAFAFKLAKQASTPTLLYPYPIQHSLRAALFLADAVMLDEAAAQRLGTQLVGKPSATWLNDGTVRWRDTNGSGTLDSQAQNATTFYSALAVGLANGYSLRAAAAFASHSGG